MLAVAGCGADLEDFADRLAALELALENAELVLDAAERGNDLQFHASVRSRVAHARPRLCGALGQPLRALLRVVADADEPAWFAHAPERPHAAVIARHAERMRLLDAGARIGGSRWGRGRVSHCD